MTAQTTTTNYAYDWIAINDTTRQPPNDVRLNVIIRDLFGATHKAVALYREGQWQGVSGRVLYWCRESWYVPAVPDELAQSMA